MFTEKRAKMLTLPYYLCITKNVLPISLTENNGSPTNKLRDYRDLAITKYFKRIRFQNFPL